MIKIITNGYLIAYISETSPAAFLKTTETLSSWGKQFDDNIQFDYISEEHEQRIFVCSHELEKDLIKDLALFIKKHLGDIVFWVRKF